MQGRVVVAVCAAALSSGTPRARIDAQPTPPARFAPGLVAPATSLAAARDAQRDFERRRRQRLPTSYDGGSAGPCEVRIGRLCYWNNNHERVPPEPAAIAALRSELLARLATAVRGDSTDDWVVGQLVRYYDESRRFDDAVAAAGACAGTPWWCVALRGLAHHQRGDHEAAAVAFDSALALQPEPLRCAWTDVRPWLDGALEREFKRVPCGPARDAWLRRFWAAARPLLMLPGNDLRSELFARHAMARIQAGSALPYELTWGDDMAELEMRYGWPTAWSARLATSYALGSPRSIVGHEPTPSFAFVPTRDAPVTTLGAAESDAWALDAPLALMRYAPRYATHGFVPLPHQLARFRRGDSTLVVGAWDLASDDRWARDTLPPPKDTAGAPIADTLHAGLVVVDSGGGESRIVADSAGPHGALSVVVPSGASLASLELLAQPRGRAARARYGLPALPRDSLASDILLLAHGAAPDARLEDVLADALGNRTIAAGVPIGVYWETYFPPDTAAPSEVTVRATRIDARWYARLGRALRLDGVLGGPQTPIAVRFVDAQRPGERWLGRTVALTWPREATGTYRLEVSVRSGEHVATTSEIVRVR